jgi:hypothetical protein
MIGKLTLSSAALLLITSAAFANPPVEDIGKRHPNLAAAQRLSRDAWVRVTAAQKANEWDMDGHAAKAKELLDKVNEELKMAAEAANKDHKK